MDWVKLFEYDPSSPTFLTNLTNRSPKARAGKPAGCVGTKEVKVNIGGKFHRNARIIWEMFNGEISSTMLIGFKDKNEFNCAIENLYLQSRRDKGIKSNQHVSSSTGLRGVYNIKGKFHAYAKIMGKTSYLGTYPDVASAASARRAALRFIDGRLNEKKA